MQGAVTMPVGGFLPLTGVHHGGGHALFGPNAYNMNHAQMIGFPEVHPGLYTHHTGMAAVSQHFLIPSTHGVAINVMYAYRIYSTSVALPNPVQPPTFLPRLSKFERRDSNHLMVPPPAHLLNTPCPNWRQYRLGL